MQCPGCGQEVSWTCPKCGWCVSCCNCDLWPCQSKNRLPEIATCPRCGGYPLCGKCGYCFACCECEDLLCKEDDPEIEIKPEQPKEIEEPEWQPDDPEEIHEIKLPDNWREPESFSLIDTLQAKEDDDG